MVLKQRYWIKPRRDKVFLSEVFHYFCGSGVKLLLEGDLKRFHFEQILGNSNVLSEPFLRQAPEAEEFVILPLDQSNIETILKKIMPSNGFKKQIAAIQIVKDGTVQFMTGDNFHHECISMHSDTQSQFLERLRSELIIKQFHKR